MPQVRGRPRNHPTAKPYRSPYRCGYTHRDEYPCTAAAQFVCWHNSGKERLSCAPHLAHLVREMTRRTEITHVRWIQRGDHP